MSAAQLRNQLDGLTLRDAARIGKRLKNLRAAPPEKLRRLADQIAAAQPILNDYSPPLSTYSAPGGLPQDPGAGAKSLSETEIHRNRGVQWVFRGRQKIGRASWRERV